LAGKSSRRLAEAPPASSAGLPRSRPAPHPPCVRHKQSGTNRGEEDAATGSSRRFLDAWPEFDQLQTDGLQHAVEIWNTSALVKRRTAKPWAASAAVRAASQASSSSVECVAPSTSITSLASNEAKSAMKPPRATWRRETGRPRRAQVATATGSLYSGERTMASGGSCGRALVLFCAPQEGRDDRDPKACGDSCR
jgi:hypothetical protein